MQEALSFFRMKKEAQPKRLRKAWKAQEALSGDQTCSSTWQIWNGRQNKLLVKATNTWCKSLLQRASIQE